MVLNRDNDDYGDREHSRHGEAKAGTESSLGTFTRMGWNVANRFLREQGEDVVGRALVTAAPKLGINQKKAVQIGRNITRYGIMFGMNLRDAQKVVSTALDENTAILKDVGIFLQGEFEGKLSNVNPTLAMMRSENEVIQVATWRLLGHTKVNSYAAAAGLLERAPEIVEEFSHPRGGGAHIASHSPENPNEPARLGAADIRTLYETGAQTISPYVQEKIRTMGRERFGQDTALDLIRDLSRQVKENPESEYFTTPKGAEYTLTDYVMEVFKRHQHNVGGPLLTDRARCYDDLKKASAVIAGEIQDNKLDPMALVALVGERHVLKKDFKVAKPQEIRQAINDVKDLYDRHEEVKVKDFLANTAYSREELKATVDGLQGENKAFFAQLFPRKVLRASGIADEQIDALRKQSRGDFEAHVSSAVQSLAAMEESQLRELGFGVSDIKKLGELNTRLEDAGKLAAADRDTATDILRGVKAQGENSWQKKVTLARDKAPDPLLAETTESQPEGEKSHAARVSKRRGSDEMSLSS